MKKIASFFYSLSIYTKLTFLIFVTVSFVTSTAVLVTHYNTNKQTDKIIYELLNTAISANETLVLEFILTDDAWQLYKFLSMLCDKTSLVQYAGFITHNNTVLAHTQTQKYRTGDTYTNNDKDIYKIPFETQGLSLGYFVLKLEKASFAKKIESIFFANIAFIFLSAIFSFIIANIFMRKLLGRLDIVSANAKSIAKHHWDDLMHDKSKDNDEITQLIDTTESLMFDIKHSIETTEEQKNFYHYILQSIDSLIVICDKQMNLLYQNNHHFSRCILTNDQRFITEAILSTIIVNINHDNTSFFIPLSCSFEDQREEQPIFVTLHHIQDNIVLSFSDMTQVKQDSDNEKVVNSLKVLGEISSLFAHEIKNLIQPLKLLLPKDEIPDKEDIAIVNLTIDKIDKQIMDYLLLRKPIDKNVANPIAIKPILDSLILVYKKALEEKQLSLLVTMDEHAMVFMGKESVELILINLLKNAIEASFVKMQISIEWKNIDEKMGLLVVQNTCENMSLHAKENLFKPFFTTKKDGTGLGLFTVYRIVYLCNGHINIVHGHNSIAFYLYIPKKEFV